MATIMDYYNQLQKQNEVNNVEDNSEENNNIKNESLLTKEALNLNSMNNDVREQYIKDRGYNEQDISVFKNRGYDPSAISTSAGLRGTAGGVVGGLYKGIGAFGDATSVVGEVLGSEDIRNAGDSFSKISKDTGDYFNKEISGEEFNNKLQRGDLSAKGVSLISEGVGQIAPMIVGGVAIRGLTGASKVANIAGQSGFGGLMSAGDLYSSTVESDMKDNKLSRDDAGKKGLESLGTAEGIGSLALGAGGQTLLLGRGVAGGLEFSASKLGSVGRGIGIEGTGESLEEGLQEKAKQNTLNPNKDTDWSKVKQAAIEGAISSIGGGSIAGVSNYRSADNFKRESIPLSYDGANKRAEYLKKQNKDSNTEYEVVNSRDEDKNIISNRFDVVSYNVNERKEQEDAQVKFDKEINPLFEDKENLDRNNGLKKEILDTIKEKNPNIYDLAFEESNYKKQLHLNDLSKNNINELEYLSKDFSDVNKEEFNKVYKDAFEKNNTLTTDILNTSELNNITKEKLLNFVSNSKSVSNYLDLDHLILENENVKDFVLKNNKTYSDIIGITNIVNKTEITKNENVEKENDKLYRNNNNIANNEIEIETIKSDKEYGKLKTEKQLEELYNNHKKAKEDYSNTKKEVLQELKDINEKKRLLDVNDSNYINNKEFLENQKSFNEKELSKLNLESSKFIGVDFSKILNNKKLNDIYNSKNKTEEEVNILKNALEEKNNVLKEQKSNLDKTSEDYKTKNYYLDNVSNLVSKELSKLNLESSKFIGVDFSKILNNKKLNEIKESFKDIDLKKLKNKNEEELINLKNEKISLELKVKELNKSNNITIKEKSSLISKYNSDISKINNSISSIQEEIQSIDNGIVILEESNKDNINKILEQEKLINLKEELNNISNNIKKLQNNNNLTTKDINILTKEYNVNREKIVKEISLKEGLNSNEKSLKGIEAKKKSLIDKRENINKLENEITNQQKISINRDLIKGYEKKISNLKTNNKSSKEVISKLEKEFKDKISSLNKESAKLKEELNKSNIVGSIKKTNDIKINFESRIKIDTVAKEFFSKYKGFDYKIFNSTKTFADSISNSESSRSKILKNQPRAMIDLSTGNISLNQMVLVEDFNKSNYKKLDKTFENYVEDILKHEIIGHAALNYHFNGNETLKKSYLEKLLNDNNILNDLIKEKLSGYDNQLYIAVEEVLSDIATGHVEYNGNIITIDEYNNIKPNSKSSILDTIIDAMKRMFGNKSNLSKGILELQNEVEKFNDKFNNSDYGNFINEVYSNTTNQQRNNLRFSGDALSSQQNNLINNNEKEKGLINEYISDKLKGITTLDYFRDLGSLTKKHPKLEKFFNSIRDYNIINNIQKHVINRNGLMEYNRLTNGELTKEEEKLLKKILSKEDKDMVNDILNKENTNKKEEDKSKLTVEQKELYDSARKSIESSLDIANKGDIFKILYQSDILNESELKSLKDKFIIGDPNTFTTVSDFVNESNEILDNLDLDEKKANVLEEVKKSINEIDKRVTELKEQKYIPNMRFGKHYIQYYKNIKGNNIYHFELFEGINERNKRAIELRKDIDVSFEDKKEYKEGEEKKPFEYKGEIDKALYSSIESEPFLVSDVIDSIIANGNYNDANSRKIIEDIKNDSLKNTLKGYSQRFAKRNNIAGYSNNMERVINTFATNAAAYSSRRTELSIARKELEIIKKEKGTNGEIEFADKYLSSIDTPTPKQLSALKIINSFIYLGFNVSSAAINFVGIPMVIVPYYNQFLKNTASRSIKAIRLMGSNYESDNGNYSIVDKYLEGTPYTLEQKNEFKKRYDLIVRGGYITNNEFSDMDIKTNSDGAIKAGFMKVFDASMYFMKKTEIGTRKMNALLAIESSLNLKEKDLKGLGYKDKDGFVIGSIDRTMGNFSKTNTPMAFKSPLMQTLYMFKNYPLTILSTMAQLGTNGIFKRDKKQLRAFGYMMLLAVLVNGTRGIPMGEDAEDFIKSLAKRFGFNPQNAKLENIPIIGNVLSKGLLPEEFSSLTARATSGNIIPGTKLLDPTLNNSQRLNQAKEVFGPGIGYFLNIALHPYDMNSYYPTVAKNVIKGVNIGLDKKIVDNNGNLVADDVGIGSAVSRGLGFQPLAESKGKYTTREIQDLDALIKYKKSNAYDLIAKATINKDPELKKKGMEIIKNWNESNPTHKIQVNSSAIKSKIDRMRKTKSELIRASLSKEVRKDFDDMEDEED